MAAISTPGTRVVRYDRLDLAGTVVERFGHKQARVQWDDDERPVGGATTCEAIRNLVRLDKVVKITTASGQDIYMDFPA